MNQPTVLDVLESESSLGDGRSNVESDGLKYAHITARGGQVPEYYILEIYYGELKKHEERRDTVGTAVNLIGRKTYRKGKAGERYLIAVSRNL